MIREFIEDLRAWWSYICYGQFGEEDPFEEPIVPKSEKDPRDKVSSNLYLGKVIDDGSIKCQVVGLHGNNMHVKILDISWDRMGTYLDIGKVYPVFRHSGWDVNKIQVWEISPKHMKRDTSQVILQWEEGIGWVWDLDM